MSKKFFIVFDGPPSHESGRFVEVETESGISIKAGKWTRRDGFWLLGPFQEARDDSELLSSANCALAEQLRLAYILRLALQGLLELQNVPVKNCSCHISPPCNDCVEFAALREAIEDANLAVGKEIAENGYPGSLAVAIRLESGRTIAEEVDGSRWLEITDSEANAMIDAKDHRVPLI
jgi:hypothetical protein